MNNLDNTINFGFSVEYQKSSKSINISYRNFRTKVKNIKFDVNTKDDIILIVTEELKKLINESVFRHDSESDFDIFNPYTITEDNYEEFIKCFMQRFIIDEHMITRITPLSLHDMSPKLTKMFFDDIYQLMTTHDDRSLVIYDDLMHKYKKYEYRLVLACIAIAYDYIDLLSAVLRAEFKLIKDISILIISCIFNRLNTLELLEAIGLDIHAHNDVGCYVAIIWNSYNVAEYLIRNDSKFNHYNNTGFTIACTNGYNNIVDLLLMRGVTIDSDYGAAIKSAIKNHNDYIVDRIIAYGIHRSDHFINILDYASNERKSGYDYAFKALRKYLCKI